jgi:peptidyl-prolyl cis-trans isomerase SurA
MKKNVVLALMLSVVSSAFAQNDPTVMTINGQPVPRSEFEYSYNKNNAEGVIDKKSVDEYVDLFINYKLKVQAALDAKLDTMSSFKTEFAGYRDQQIKPAIIDDNDVEKLAKSIYNETKERVDASGGMVKLSHILLLVRQSDDEAKKAEVKARIDSIYNELQKGADFADMARRFSQDPGSARKGGELSWVQKGMTFKEFEDVAFALQPGEMSKPFLSQAGYHIVLQHERGNFFPYETVHTDILRFIDRRGLREKLINEKLDSLSKLNNTTPDAIIAEKREEMENNDLDLHYLIKEYHDGLLLFEISNREVWSKTAQNEAALESFFKKNKKKYRWDEPRFKGIAYYTREAADIQAVKNAVKKAKFEDWAEILRTTFNNDSVLRIRVEKGFFKKGDNALVDRNVFKKDTLVKERNGYPNMDTFGKVLKAPENYLDVKGQVTADYNEMAEKQWVANLRKKYKVVVDKDVLKTVNKH